jgi:hypothetical protein
VSKPLAIFYFSVRFGDWMDVLLPLTGMDDSEPLSFSAALLVGYRLGGRAVKGRTMT